jgi:Zn-dependent protease
MVLNLLPILPLDGGRIAVSLLPHSLAIPYSNGPSGSGSSSSSSLLFTGALERRAGPLVDVVATLIEAVTGVDLPGSL